MATEYRIADEALPSRYSGYSVQPMWPLLAVMISHPLVGLGWFILNGEFFGSATRRRERTIAIAGIVAYFCIAYALVASGGALFTNFGGFAPYVREIPILIWLGLAYWLYMMQSRSFELYVFYEGKTANGFVAMLIAYFLRRPVGFLVAEFLDIVP